MQLVWLPTVRIPPGAHKPARNHPPGVACPKWDSTTRAAIRIPGYRQEHAVLLANIFGAGDDLGSGHAVCSRRALHEDTGRRAP